MRIAAAFIALVVAGCGRSVEPFVGSWNTTFSDGSLSCSGSNPVDLKGFPYTFTLTSADGELAPSDCRVVRLSVTGDEATLATSSPACEFGPFTDFHYQQFDLQTSDGQNITGSVMGSLPPTSGPCVLTTHLAGMRKAS